MVLEQEMDPFWSLSWADRFAYVFNRTALGLGTMFGLYSAYVGEWFRVLQVVFMIGVYFLLWHITDAP